MKCVGGIEESMEDDSHIMYDHSTAATYVPSRTSTQMTQELLYVTLSVVLGSSLLTLIAVMIVCSWRQRQRQHVLGLCYLLSSLHFNVMPSPVYATHVVIFCPVDEWISGWVCASMHASRTLSTWYPHKYWTEVYLTHSNDALWERWMRWISASEGQSSGSKWNKLSWKQHFDSGAIQYSTYCWSS